MNRRAFLGNSAKMALASSAITALAKASMAKAKEETSSKKKRLAVVGTGIRGTTTWGKKLIHPYSKYVELVGLCDINPKRVKFAQKYIETDAPTYLARDFDRMIAETKPDAVIVTTPDCFHAGYAIRAMELGCDAIVEKPLATTAEQCQRLLDAEIRTARELTTTFNARHSKTADEVKKVILSSELGRVISAGFYEYLDIHHGASYFRRWHGKKRFSGSLLVHKATHHFDQMNWWLDAEPEEVNAYGKVAFYGKNNSFRSQKCRGCPFADKCEFYYDITENQLNMDLYVKCEDEDGYHRDGCVWDNEIDTYDTMTVEVKYKNGVQLSYTLDAFMPYEGQRVYFNGEKGRLDVRRYGRQPWDVDCESKLRLTKNFKDTKVWQVQSYRKKDEGAFKGHGHGGSDERLKDLLFIPDTPDPLLKKAGARAGVMSSLIGIAAVKSIETGQRIKIADLIRFPLEWQW